ncbi:MAG: molybdenum cofactor biosynthesis protein MoaE [Anaerolineae bacterium]
MADGHFEVTPTPLSLDAVVARLTHPSVGAVSTFVGIVRRDTDDRTTEHLDYEAYPDMAEQQLRQIGEEIGERWPGIRETAIVHRTGRLKPGEISVVIAVSAAHRRDVFAATHYAIDRLKEIVPIWKKEVWANGEAWRTRGSEREETAT